jgi:hypothetical protein
MRFTGLRVIPIHYYLLLIIGVAILALGIFAATHGLDVQHFWHTAIIHQHAADTDFIGHHH